jgi:hypothetical protein
MRATSSGIAAKYADDIVREARKIVIPDTAEVSKELRSLKNTPESATASAYTEAKKRYENAKARQRVYTAALEGSRYAMKTLHEYSKGSKTKAPAREAHWDFMLTAGERDELSLKLDEVVKELDVVDLELHAAADAVKAAAAKMNEIASEKSSSVNSAKAEPAPNRLPASTLTDFFGKAPFSSEGNITLNKKERARYPKAIVANLEALSRMKRGLNRCVTLAAELEVKFAKKKEQNPFKMFSTDPDLPRKHKIWSEEAVRLQQQIKALAKVGPVLETSIDSMEADLLAMCNAPETIAPLETDRHREAVELVGSIAAGKLDEVDSFMKVYSRSIDLTDASKTIVFAALSGALVTHGAGDVTSGAALGGLTGAALMLAAGSHSAGQASRAVFVLLLVMYALGMLGEAGHPG